MGCDNGFNFPYHSAFISIHAPIVGCDHEEQITELQYQIISIHAPIVGCDKIRFGYSYDHITISIHAPIVGCDKKRIEVSASHKLFQSTHPSWGATMASASTTRNLSDFNPRTHRGVRPTVITMFLGFNLISIHAPIVGCDRITLEYFKSRSISIHAPIVGCDEVLPRRLHHVKNFNPRTHRGVRPIHAVERQRL